MWSAPAKRSPGDFSPTTTVIDGHWGFGFHVNAKAMALTIEKAKTANVAACTVFRQSHVGRLGAYPIMAMREGMIGLATADSGRSPKNVAPFGGREARLGTNPISIAVPSDLEGPFCLDMATSAVAAGKIALAVARSEQIPQGWIIDSDGRHTTDPKDFRKGGALLPLGGTEGYKGSGLAAMVEVLCGLLTGLGFGVEPTGRHNDGCFMAVFNVAAFRPLQDFKFHQFSATCLFKIKDQLIAFSETEIEEFFTHGGDSYCAFIDVDGSLGGKGNA